MTLKKIRNGEEIDLTPEEEAAVMAERAAEVQPTAAMVNIERDRRVLAGTTLSVTGYGTPIDLQGGDRDQMVLLALAALAEKKIALGDLSTIQFRDRENVNHDLTPAQIIELWLLGTAWVQQVYAAAWTLKDDPGGIPADYDANGNWP